MEKYDQNVIDEILKNVEISGDTTVLLPSLYLSNIERLVSKIQERGLRMAGVPLGSITILPAVPLAKADLVDIGVKFNKVSNSQEKCILHQELYNAPFPLFKRTTFDGAPVLYHPADYVLRILHVLQKVCSSTEKEFKTLLGTNAFLQISPVREAAFELRSTCELSNVQSETSHSQEKIVTDQILQAGNSSVCKEGSLPVPDTFATSISESNTSAYKDEWHDSSSDEIYFHDDGSDEEENKTERETLEMAQKTPSKEITTELPLEDLTGEEVVDDTTHAEYLCEDDFVCARNDEIYHTDSDGKIVAVFLHNIIPRELCLQATASLKRAATKKNMRAKVNGGIPPDTGVVGFYDYINNPTQKKCRETQFMRENSKAIEKGCKPFMKELDRLYQKYTPLYHKLQKEAIPPEFELFNTVFSTITVNVNFRTACHVDKGDFRNGLGAVCVVDGSFDGCDLAIKKLRKRFPLKVGDVLFFDTALEHGNTEVHNPMFCWERISLVCYLRIGLATAFCQQERRKELHRRLISQIKSGSESLQHTTVINMNAGDERLVPLYVPAGLAEKLAPVQTAALHFASSRIQKNTGCVLAMTMGLGKTLVALTLCFSFLYRNQTSVILIVCPKPIIQHWETEYKKWYPLGLRFKNFVTGINSEREKEQAPGDNDRGTIYVVNPESLANFLTLRENFNPALIFVDEGHKVSYKGSKLMECLDKMGNGIHIALTGTPLQNEAEELYRLICWVNVSVKHAFPLKSFQSYANTIKQYIMGFSDDLETAVQAQKFLLTWMEAFVFREMQVDLPPLRDYFLVCNSSPLQLALFERIHFVEADTLSATEYRPHLISTHPLCYFGHLAGKYNENKKRERSCEEDKENAEFLDEDREKMEKWTKCVYAGDVNSFLSASGKLKILSEIVGNIAQRGEKVIIFSQHVPSQDLIHRVLFALKVHSVTMRGRDSYENRRAAVEKFKKDDSCTAIVLSTRIAAFGLDFTEANHVILFDSWWNPQVEYQAIARTYRQNQKKPVTVYRLASSTSDSMVLQTQSRKNALFECIFHEKTGRQVLMNELEDCRVTDGSEEHKSLWAVLRNTSLEGGTPALHSVHLCRSVKTYEN